MKKNREPLETIQRISYLLFVGSLMVTVLSGLLLAFYYIPTPQQALLSLLHLKEHLFGGSYVVAIHRLSGTVAFILLWGNGLLTLWIKGPFKSYRQILSVFFLLSICFILFRITGFILQGDELALTSLQMLFLKSGSSTNLRLPSLVSPLSLLFIKFYLLHILILPLFVFIILKRVFIAYIDNGGKRNAASPLVSPYFIFIVYTFCLITIVMISHSFFPSFWGTASQIPLTMNVLLFLERSLSISLIAVGIVLLVALCWYGSLSSRKKEL